MVSAAYDWRADKKWQPYLGAGVGQSTIEVDLAQTIGNVAVVVDDDNRIRDLLKDFLTENNYIVSTAENAIQALQHFFSLNK